ncbi:hypothetical protein E3O42_16890 [Cryobacterium adonitolivorans]|uniref:Spore protein YkvP/CgeB glycosyl transferase-like domain-containing protein n=1 Tax=Cryobacterium adonitolivorans TaxID=1259189 RepID=A0A4R8VZF8_9MICO|nr:glycosyltransferase [Cryobacterium adonitolivorans]TFB96814.1 hypothetical protein E3O42_16890 [Cryobacterium adonitolivorans]
MSESPAPSPRALFLSPSFFGYESDIERALIDDGYAVDFFDERPTNSSAAKAIFRIGGRPVQLLVQAYYRRILAATVTNSYDLVLVIKGEVVPLSFLQEFRRRNPDAHFVYYSFDAIPAGSNCTRLFDEFDALYSFDPADVAADARFTLKPLFYSSQFSSSSPESPRSHDLTFVGTMHSDRYRFVTSLFKSFTNTYGFFYVPARWYFYFNKYISRNFAGVPTSTVSFAKLDKSAVAAIFRDSRAVLDLQRSAQSGLTMRTFEVLASGAVLVTGNTAIRQSELFDPSRIVVVDDYDAADASTRLREVLDALPPLVGAPNGFERHSIENWVREFSK